MMARNEHTVKTWRPENECELFCYSKRLSVHSNSCVVPILSQNLNENDYNIRIFTHTNVRFEFTSYQKHRIQQSLNHSYHGDMLFGSTKTGPKYMT